MQTSVIVHLIDLLQFVFCLLNVTFRGAHQFSRQAGLIGGMVSVKLRLTLAVEYIHTVDQNIMAILIHLRHGTDNDHLVLF